MIYVSSFVSFSFVSRDILITSDSFSIDSFPIEMYGSMGLCVYIDPIHGLTSWINENVQKLYLPLPFYESLPFCVWHRHSLLQHPLIRNLI